MAGPPKNINGCETKHITGCEWTASGTTPLLVVLICVSVAAGFRFQAVVNIRTNVSMPAACRRVCHKAPESWNVLHSAPRVCGWRVRTCPCPRTRAFAAMQMLIEGLNDVVETSWDVRDRRFESGARQSQCSAALEFPELHLSCRAIPVVLC